MANKEIIGLPGILELYGDEAVEFHKYDQQESSDAKKKFLKEAEEYYLYQSSKQPNT